MEFEDVEAWLKLHITGYSHVFAPWVETGQDSTTKYCVLAGDGGLKPVAEARAKNFTVFLIGPVRSQQAAKTLLTDAGLVMAAIMVGEVLPCSAANIVALGEPVGPGLTSENRAWVQINIQVMF